MDKYNFIQWTGVIQMSRKLEIYDTTLRDGAQAENFNLSVDDKVRITLKLDELGIDFIEGGWPGSNPTAAQYFNEIKQVLKDASFETVDIANYNSSKQVVISGSILCERMHHRIDERVCLLIESIAK